MFDKCSRVRTFSLHHHVITVPTTYPLSYRHCWETVSEILLSQTVKVLWEFYWNFPFLIFNDNDYDVVLF